MHCAGEPWEYPWAAYTQITSGDYQGGTGGVIFGLIYSVVAISGAILMLKRRKLGQYMLVYRGYSNTLHYDDLSAVPSSTHSDCDLVAAYNNWERPRIGVDACQYS